MLSSPSAYFTRCRLFLISSLLLLLERKGANNFPFLISDDMTLFHWQSEMQTKSSQRWWSSRVVVRQRVHWPSFPLSSSFSPTAAPQTSWRTSLFDVEQQWTKLHLQEAIFHLGRKENINNKLTHRVTCHRRHGISVSPTTSRTTSPTTFTRRSELVLFSVQVLFSDDGVKKDKDAKLRQNSQDCFYGSGSLKFCATCLTAVNNH